MILLICLFNNIQTITDPTTIPSKTTSSNKINIFKLISKMNLKDLNIIKSNYISKKILLMGTRISKNIKPLYTYVGIYDIKDHAGKYFLGVEYTLSRSKTLFVKRHLQSKDL